MKFAIFDLDGCLSDDRHRRHLLPAYGSPQEEYEAYHKQCARDELAQEGYKHFCRAMRARLTPIFVTSRPADARYATALWLKQKLDIDAPVILMRPDNNKQTSPELKPHLLTSRGITPEKVAFAVDDRDDVLAAYAQWGLTRDALYKVALNDLPPAPLHWHCNPFPKVEDEAKTAADMLDEMAKTFVERNAVYKSNYALVGRILEVLHGDDAPSPAKDLVGTVDKFNVWHLWELIIVKITRFANSGLEHPDSIHDIAVYAAMIEAQLRNKEDKS